MLYDWPLNRRGVPILVWASSTGVNKPILERPRRPRPQHVNSLASSTTCLNTSSPTKNLTPPFTNSDSKNRRSPNSKSRPLRWAIPCCQPPRFHANPPCSPVQVPQKPAISAWMHMAREICGLGSQLRDLLDCDGP